MFSDIGLQRHDSKLIWANQLAAPAAIVVAVAVRAGIYLWLHNAGYFYGTAWDTFTRALLAYRWSEAPCFYCYSGYWLPLQYWIVGTVYLLLKPVITTSEILVPVAVNNLFWVGSLWITYRIGIRIGGTWAGILACLLVACFSGDIFVTYTALSEPILIFFTLLTNYFLVDFIEARWEEKGVAALKLGSAALLATATHYIGWFPALFAALFLLFGLVDSLRKSEKLSPVYLSAIILCGVIPLVWMAFSYQAHGNALRSIQVAREYQVEGVGALSTGDRFLLLVQVLLGKFTEITVAGILSIYYVSRRAPRVLLYLAIPAFTLTMIWLTTAMGLSAPDQEPRYLVFWIWATLPYIATAFVSIWQRPGIASKLVVAVGLLILLIGNSSKILNFENFFGTDVRDAGVQAELFLKQSGTHKVLVEGNTFSERWVIPVISGYPHRVDQISANELEKNWDETAAALLAREKDRLVIVKSNRFVKLARSLGLTVKRIGQYYVIYPQGDRQANSYWNIIAL